LVSSSFSLSLCPFSFVIVLSVLLFTASDYLFGTFKLLFVLLPFSEAVNRKRRDNTITKEKGQKDKEKLEDTKEIMRSRK
jgi:hypothetical protein